MRKGCLVTVGAIALTVGSVLWYLNTLAAAARAELQRELAAARAEGIPTRPSDLVLPEPPPGTNAAPLWTALVQTRARRRLAEADRMALHPNSRDPEPTPTQLRAAMERRADLVALMHGALARPRCVFHRDWAQGPALLVRETSYMRQAAVLCYTEGRVLCREGKPVQAAQHIARVFRIARQQQDEPPLILGYLVGTTTNGMAFRGMADVLRRAGTQPGVAAAVRAGIQREWRPRTLRRALGSELVMQLVGMEMLREKGGVGSVPALFRSSSPGSPADAIAFNGGWRPPYWSALVDHNAAFCVSGMRQLITSADGPYPQARNAMPGVARRSSKAGTSPDLALARTLHAPLTSLPASEAGDRARAAVTLTAASVLEWKVRHGAFPVTLAQAMPRVPQDPFDLRPIRYRREGNGFVVWSVGVSGRFGGGRRGTRYPSSEVLFRYPAPPSAVP